MNDWSTYLCCDAECLKHTKKLLPLSILFYLIIKAAEIDHSIPFMWNHILIFALDNKKKQRKMVASNQTSACSLKNSNKHKPEL